MTGELCLLPLPAPHALSPLLSSGPSKSEDDERPELDLAQKTIRQSIPLTCFYPPAGGPPGFQIAVCSQCHSSLRWAFPSWPALSACWQIWQLPKLLWQYFMMRCGCSPMQLPCGPLSPSFQVSNYPNSHPKALTFNLDDAASSNWPLCFPLHAIYLGKAFWGSTIESVP